MDPRRRIRTSGELQLFLNTLLLQQRDVDTVTKFMRSYANDIRAIVNEKDKNGQTFLHYAVQKQRLPVVTVLVDEMNADVNSMNSSNQTPLHSAVRREPHPSDEPEESEVGDGYDSLYSHPIVAFLLKRNADPDHLDSFGYAPIHLAVDLRMPFSVGELVRGGASVNIRDDDGITPLLKAASTKQSPLLLWLLEHNADVMAMDNQKQNVLHHASNSYSMMLSIKKHATKVLSPVEFTMLTNMQNLEGETPLHLAANEKSVFKLLTENGADMSAVTNSGNTVLHYLARGSCIPNFDILLKTQPNMNAYNAQRETALFTAIRYRQLKAAEYLVKHGANVNFRALEMTTPLLMAARQNQTEMMKLLIENGANLNVVDLDLMNPLFIAVEKANLKMVDLILDNVKDASLLEERDQSLNNALHIATKNGNFEIVKKLSERISILSTNADEQTPLHLVAKHHGDKAIAAFFIDKHPEVAACTDCDKNDPIHLAAGSGNTEMLEYLLEKFGNPNLENALGRTPLARAVQNNQVNCVESLLGHPTIVVNTVDKQEITPLFIACENGFTKIASMLLSKNADPTMVVASDHAEYPGWNCLDVAAFKGNLDCAELILNNDYRNRALGNETLLKNGEIDTPFRKMIRYLPAAAVLVCDQCIRSQMSSEGGESVLYDFSMVESSVKKKKKKGIDSALEGRRGLEATPKNSPRDEEALFGVHVESDELQEEKTLIVRRQAQSRLKFTTGKKSSDPLQLMVEYDRAELLNHELVQTLLVYKWVYLIGPYFLNFFIYLLYVALYTSFMLLTKPPYLVKLDLPANAPIDLTNQTAVCEHLQETGEKAFILFVWVPKYGVMALAALNLIKEFAQFIRNPLGYFNMENAVEILLYLFGILVTIDTSRCMMSTGLREDWQWYAGTIGLAFAWYNIVAFMSLLITSLGIYVGIYDQVVKNLFHLIILMSPIIIAFALTFHLLLANQIGYSEMFHSLARVLTMEVDFSGTVFTQFGKDAESVNLVAQIPLTVTFFVVFTFCMTIAMNNMWIGVAVGDVCAMQEKASIEALRIRVQLLQDSAKLLPAVGINWTIPIVYESQESPKGCVNRLIKWFQTVLPKIESTLTIDEGEDSEGSSLLSDWTNSIQSRLQSVKNKSEKLFETIDKVGELSLVLEKTQKLQEDDEKNESEESRDY